MAGFISTGPSAQMGGKPMMRDVTRFASPSALNSQKQPMFGNRRKPAPTAMPPSPMGGMRNPQNTMPMPTGMNPINVQAPGLQPAPGMGQEINAQMPMVNTGPSNMSQFNMAQSPMNQMGNTGITGGMLGGLFGQYNKLRQAY